MRVRLKSTPPLLPLKIWFEIPKQLFEDETSTIRDLKNVLLPLLGKFLKTQDVLVELDAFELGNASKLSIVRDGDLLE